MQNLADETARRAFGAERLLMRVHGGVEDIQNAMLVNDHRHLQLITRDVVHWTLSVYSLAEGGEISWGVEDILVDPYDEVDVELVESGLALVSCSVDLEAMRPEYQEQWFRSLVRFVKGAEMIVTNKGTMAKLRSSEGMWRSIRMVREWIPLVERFGYPDLIPEWMTTTWGECTE